MKPRPGDAVWLAILAYELTYPKNELLSESLDRRIDRHPLLARAAVIYTALHLANLLPSRLDAYWWAARMMGR